MEILRHKRRFRQDFGVEHREGGQVKRVICPAIRSVDYKENKLVWYEEKKSDSV